MTARLFLIATLLSLSLSPRAWANTKVVCIGNSITRGCNGHNYPSKLQDLIGYQYIVVNYGVGNQTVLLEEGNPAYMRSSKFSTARNEEGDIIIAKFGTNDSKVSVWSNTTQFKHDYNALINAMTLPGRNPHILLCLPLPAFENSLQVQGAVIADSIIPAIRELAQENGYGLIDCHTPFIGHEEYFTDGVHPDSAGFELLAQTIHQGLIDYLSSSLNAPSNKSRFGVRTRSPSYADRRLVILNPVQKRWQHGKCLYNLMGKIAPSTGSSTVRVLVEEAGRKK
ncbi:MAG: hypothetical protein GF344_01850 [Chitinivibrionales bacterium]|nr:hypothetical protein [Chitinivibrionales bacterium]MBD3355837.1 hypothetical protein [Chitinivibrionales bacterium]